MWEVIFDAEGFAKRHECGPWDTFFIVIYIAGNLLTWISYMVIPEILRAMATRGKKHQSPVAVTDTERRLIIWAFWIFVFVCGQGHLLDGVLAFVWPAYHFFAIWHLLTGVVSIAAAKIVFTYRLKLVSIITH